jgi:hypothetical protein
MGVPLRALPNIGGLIALCLNNKIRSRFHARNMEFREIVVRISKADCETLTGIGALITPAEPLSRDRNG